MNGSTSTFGSIDDESGEHADRRAKLRAKVFRQPRPPRSSKTRWTSSGSPSVPVGLSGRFLRIDPACTQARALGIDYNDRAFADNFLDTQGVWAHANDFSKLIVERRPPLPSGRTCTRRAGVTQMVTACMASGMRIDDAAKRELAYPNFTEAVGQGAQMLVRDLGVHAMPRLRSSLSPPSSEGSA
jgi:hypothetical protein